MQKAPVEVQGKTNHVISKITNHPPVPPKKFDFDIFTDKPRPGAVHYKTFEDMFTRLVKKARNLAKFGKKGET